LTAALEAKMTRSGELAVEIVQMKNDLADTEAALIEDKAFLADMEKKIASPNPMSGLLSCRPGTRSCLLSPTLSRC